MLTVNAEDQFMVITGLIRPEDITIGQPDLLPVHRRCADRLRRQGRRGRQDAAGLGHSGSGLGVAFLNRV